jgi:thiamine pyrophosphate-dependent acetolactate synthase large subunit-like protein
MILDARLPIVIAGLGAADARDAIEKMASLIGALLATTGPAKGWFDGNPSSIGLAGGYAHRLGQEAFASADLVIAIGTSLSAETVRSGQLFPDAQLLKVDIDPFPAQEDCSGGHGWAPGSMQPHHLVLGDARLTVEAISSLLEARGHLSRGFRDHEVFAALQERDQRQDDLAEAAWVLEKGTVDPRRVIIKLDELLPKECIVFIGGGHFMNFPLMFLNGFRSRRFFYTPAKSFGIIGQALTMGCGAALGNRDVPVVVFEGDGSTMMNIQELDTAARYGARFLLFVMNDAAMEFQAMRRRGHDPKWGLIPTPSFASLATSFGLVGHDVRSEDEIEPAVRSFLAGSGTHVVDVHCDRNVSSPASRSSPRGLRTP